MGYRAYSQLFVGTEINNVIEVVHESKNIDILDDWTNKVKGTKRVDREFYKFNGESFTEIYYMEEKMKTMGLSLFYSNGESGLFEDVYVGIGKQTTYGNNTIRMTIEDLQSDIEKVKVIFETLGYTGEVEVYSNLYESY